MPGVRSQIGLGAFRRLLSAGAFVAALGVALGACGDAQSHDGTSLRSARSTVTQPAGSDQAPAATEPNAPPVKPPPAPRLGQPPQPPHIALAGLPVARRIALAERVAGQVLGPLGFKHASARASQGGAVLSIVFPRRQACKASPTVQAAILRDTTRVAPYVHQIIMTTRATPAPLASYVALHCRHASGAQVAGPVVLDQTGSGAASTATFAISSRRWTVAFDNSETLQIQVLGAHALLGTLAASDPGAGQKSFRGPGRFHLQIIGARGWTVQVRDGA